ncbi:hypothetical protein LRS10_12710 [Phenylobacterium sp. J426]|uniref:hypothetical protein n=1 Tax=Phenylobacterium sp. J426 TaxID=2898439 RepID=UPI0021513542|nr:hypothetical protein [Phenylobacterium sp. J426]MCR5874961.1 hypothetical protein [Phenylobacterium sp. J426]
MLGAILAAALAATAPDCSYDRSALLALDQQAFDQDPKGGWRAIANRPGCEAAAADLLRDYRLAHPRSSNEGILYWHEGQLRAFAGDAPSAAPLLAKSRKVTDTAAWNPYVDATIAFLEGDKPRLLAARETLIAATPPPTWAQTVADAEARFGVRFSWPPNLDVVDGLIACFGRPYREAYVSPCRR